MVKVRGLWPRGTGFCTDSLGSSGVDGKGWMTQWLILLLDNKDINRRLHSVSHEDSGEQQLLLEVC